MHKVLLLNYLGKRLEIIGHRSACIFINYLYGESLFCSKIDLVKTKIIFPNNLSFFSTIICRHKLNYFFKFNSMVCLKNTQLVIQYERYIEFLNSYSKYFQNFLNLYEISYF